MENMQKCYERYVGHSSLLKNERVRVVDIGGANVNGSYADIFSDSKFEYVAVDLATGEGVDVVLEDPNVLPFDSGSVDIVISGQVFEHAEFFWKLFEEAARVVCETGFIFLIVPSAGPIHRFPVDCYRFYPDAMRALSRYADIELLEVWHDDRGPWNDLVGVFAHEFEPDPGVGDALPPNRYLVENQVAPLTIEAKSSGQDRVSGNTPYIEALKFVHRQLQPRGYLEIGVRTGTSLALATCPAMGIDPQPELKDELPHHHQLYQMTSDTFFDRWAKSELENVDVDLAFIDGMHLFEFALRDFMNIEQNASATTVVVIDDIYPNHPDQAARKRQTRVWTGDVWKLHHCLQTNRPDLVLIPLNTSPTGLLVITGLDPTNRVLRENYNPLVRRYKDMPLDTTVLERPSALELDDPRVESLLVHLRSERE